MLKIPYIILGAWVLVIFISGCISNQSAYSEDTTPYAECDSCCSECPPIQQEALSQCEESLEQCGTEISNTCYENNMISQLQAENIAKHYALIQVKLVNPYTSLSDIRVHTSSTIGEKCNPDWLVTLRFDDTQNDKGYLWWIRVNGRIENATLQGIVDLPFDYVMSNVEEAYEYHTSISQFPYVGSSSVHSSPY